MSVVLTRYGSFQIIDTDVTISRSLSLYGEWAQLEIETLAPFIMPGSVVVDGGAFIGTHALAFSTFVGPLGSVLAFEPNRPFANILRDNASRAPFDNIHVRNCALGATPGSIGVPRTNLTDTTNFGALSLADAADIDETAVMCPLDALQIERLDFLKADVEGMELDVLRGAEKTIARCRPVIFAEGNSLSSSSALLEWSHGHQYLSFGVLTPAYNPLNYTGNVENCFGEACEVGLLLLPAERSSHYADIIRDRRLPEIVTLDDLAILLLHKPQYPLEILANTSVAKILGMNYPSPLAFARLAQMDQMNQFLEERNVQVTSLGQAIAERDDALGHRDSQLKGLAQSVADSDATVARLNTEITSLVEATAERNAALAERDEQIAGLKRSLAGRDAAIRLWTSQVDRLTQSVKNLNKALKERDADVAGRKVELVDLTRSLAESNETIAGREALIAAILASRSWRMTEPLRRGLRLLSGIRSGAIRDKARKELSETAQPEEQHKTEITTPTSDPLSNNDQKDEISLAEDREEKPEDQQRSIVMADLLRADFDVHYYLGQYPDVAAAGVDPILHYIEFGAAELRNPTPDFSTRYYLEANPDVKTACINPFLHFVLHGRREGRVCKPPGGYRFQYLEQLNPLQQTVQNWRVEARVCPISMDVLVDTLRVVFTPNKTRGVLSFSHDDYTTEVGGIQLCLLVEQSAFEEQDCVYLNFHPSQPLPVLAEADDPDELLLNIICNGESLGDARAGDIARAIEKFSDSVDFSLAVHAMHGHAPESIKIIAAAAQVRKAFFWVHDYFSICPGYNLLRNGISYCGAPPIDSPACRICVFGEARPEHFARVMDLFEAVRFTVVSPSATALEIWRTRSGLRHEGTLIHPHCRVEPLEANPVSHAPASRSIRVAFLGYPVLQKGWPVFAELLDRFNGNPAYEFHYLGAAPPQDGRLNVTNVSLTRQNRSAMVNAIACDSIDFVVLWALWPETFSFTTFEAIAGGAHILTCSSAGNIARVVSENALGRIFQNETDLFGFFESGEAQRYIQQRRRPDGPAARLVFNQMTADLVGIE